MTSTIPLSQKVKEILTTYKASQNESYEDAITNLISEVERKKQKDEKLLKKILSRISKRKSKNFKRMGTFRQ